MCISGIISANFMLGSDKALELRTTSGVRYLEFCSPDDALSARLWIDQGKSFEDIDPKLVRCSSEVPVK